MLVKPLQHRPQTGSSQADAGICGSIINSKSIAVGRQRISTGKYHVVDVATLLVSFLGPENPFVAAQQAMLRRVQIKQSKPQSVDGARRGVADAMVNDQPTLRGFDRR